MNPEAKRTGGQNRVLFLMSTALAAMTVVLLLAGALVTSNEAGDSVPDWPMSFGRWLIGSDLFVGNVRYEYSHRAIAGVVAILTFILAVWTTRTESRSWIKRLAWLAFALVIVQALVGGLRVLFPTYRAAIAVPHALIAQSFFCLVVSIAVFTSKGWFRLAEVKADRTPSLRRLSSITIGLVLVQLVLGAGFRHQAWGIIPHIAGAVAVTAVVAWLVVMVLKRHGDQAYLRRPALGAASLLGVQLVLGVAAYLARLASAGDPQPLEPMISLTVAHLVVGALTLATLLVLTLRCHRVLAPAVDRQVPRDGSPTVETRRRATV